MADMKDDQKPIQQENPSGICSICGADSSVQESIELFKDRMMFWKDMGAIFCANCNVFRLADMVDRLMLQKAASMPDMPEVTTPEEKKIN